MSSVSTLRSKIRSGQQVVGCFVKTPTLHVVELLGAARLDYAVADREHAPLDLACIDGMVAAAKGVGLPLLVRVSSHDPSSIMAALDIGCAGILVPHVRNADEVLNILDAVKYSRGRRGFSPSARAGGYGAREHAEYKRTADEESMILVQIEDREALDRLDEIASIEDVDCLFIGPADLANSLGIDMSDPKLNEEIARIVSAGRRNRKPVGIFVPDADKFGRFMEMGISTFICGSDQSLISTGARQIRHTFDRVVATYLSSIATFLSELIPRR